VYLDRRSCFVQRAESVDPAPALIDGSVGIDPLQHFDRCHVCSGGIDDVSIASARGDVPDGVVGGVGHPELGWGRRRLVDAHRGPRGLRHLAFTEQGNATPDEGCSDHYTSGGHQSLRDR